MPISVDDRFTTHGLTSIYVDKQPIPASRIYHPNYCSEQKATNVEMSLTSSSDNLKRRQKTIMSEYFKNIDPSYDKALEGIAGLTWWPWVGKSYRETDTKTFVLGESHYCSNPGADAVAKIVNKKALTREIHQTHAMGLANGKKTRYVRNIERALFRTKRPSVESVNAFWSSVIYHNLVLTPMPTKKNRPAFDHYIDGWAVFLQLAELLKPAQCIVYGLEGTKLTSLKEVCISRGNPPLFEKLPNKVNRSCPKRVTLTLNYGALKMLFIRHPSQYFSWQTWGEILEKEIHLPAAAA